MNTQMGKIPVGQCLGLLFLWGGRKGSPNERTVLYCETVNFKKKGGRGGREERERERKRQIYIQSRKPKDYIT